MPGLPFEDSAPDIVGCVTMMGTGDITWTMAPMPDAETGMVPQPSSFMKVAGTLLVTVTWRRFIGSTELKFEKVTPVGFGVYVTVSPAAPKPFNVWAK